MISVQSYLSAITIFSSIFRKAYFYFILREAIYTQGAQEVEKGKDCN